MNPAKPFFLLFGSLLIAGPCLAVEDLNQVELGIHELAEMKTLKGVNLVFDPTKISMVFTLPRSPGSSPGSGGGITNVIGLAGGPQEVDEPALSFLQRLSLSSYFIPLTLPDGNPIWVKASAVSFFRAVEPWDHTRSEAKSAVNAGGRPIFVKQDVTAIKDAINALRRQNKSR